jgi:hypothetical protein
LGQGFDRPAELHNPGEGVALVLLGILDIQTKLGGQLAGGCEITAVIG